MELLLFLFAKRPAQSCRVLDRLQTELQGFALVTPGVRSSDGDLHDQKRVSTPEKAIANGASYLVIGRQLTQAQDPVAEIEKIEQEIKAGLQTREERSKS